MRGEHLLAARSLSAPPSMRAAAGIFRHNPSGLEPGAPELVTPAAPTSKFQSMFRLGSRRIYNSEPQSCLSGVMASGRGNNLPNRRRQVESDT